MRKKHRIGTAVPDLFGADENILFSRIYIKKKLGSVNDFVDGMDRMLSANQRKESYRVEDKQKRTGNSEKITHHQIRGPRRLKLGKAIKNIKSVSACLFNRIVNFDGKIFKTVRKRNSYRFNLGHIRDERFVARKAEIDYFSLVLYRLSDIRFHKKPEFV